MNKNTFFECNVVLTGKKDIVVAASMLTILVNKVLEIEGDEVPNRLKLTHPEVVVTVVINEPKKEIRLNFQSKVQNT
jgi:hypothetical protein